MQAVAVPKFYFILFFSVQLASPHLVWVRWRTMSSSIGCMCISKLYLQPIKCCLYRPQKKLELRFCCCCCCIAMCHTAIEAVMLQFSFWHDGMTLFAKSTCLKYLLDFNMIFGQSLATNLVVADGTTPHYKN